MVLVIAIGVLICLIDQISKIIVTSNMSLREEIVVIKDFFSFFYVRNDGVAFSMDVSLWILIIITVIAVAAFIYISRKYRWKDNKFEIIVFGMLLGGTLGNFLDRIFQADHCVIDFLSFTLYYPSFTGGFHFESFPFAVFNIADSFLVVGAILLMIYYLFIEPKKEKKNKNAN